MLSMPFAMDSAETNMLLIVVARQSRGAWRTRNDHQFYVFLLHRFGHQCPFPSELEDGQMERGGHLSRLAWVTAPSHSHRRRSHTMYPTYLWGFVLIYLSPRHLTRCLFKVLSEQGDDVFRGSLGREREWASRRSHVPTDRWGFGRRTVP